MKEFKWKLSHTKYKVLKPLPRGQVKHLDRIDLADRMISYYMEADALEVTLEILKNMNLNDLDERLNEDLQKCNHAFNFSCFSYKIFRLLNAYTVLCKSLRQSKEMFKALTHFDRHNIIVLPQHKDNLNIIVFPCLRLLHSTVLYSIIWEMMNSLLQTDAEDRMNLSNFR
uniref:Pyrin domain-containing protein n=1 Tax=Paramormyrops kingsleyae TaxID=1676925 RepID=A0A3B3SWY7_9TELE